MRSLKAPPSIRYSIDLIPLKYPKRHLIVRSLEVSKPEIGGLNCHIGVKFSNTLVWKFQTHMMTSSNGNIFRVTSPLYGEFTSPGEFPTHRAVTRSFDVFFDLHLNKRLSKQPRGSWFEMPSWSLWHQCNEILRLWDFTRCYNKTGFLSQGWFQACAQPMKDVVTK